jgi:hypothetical protein
MVMYDVKNKKDKDEQEDYVSLGCNRPLIHTPEEQQSQVGSDPMYQMVPSFSESRKCYFNPEEDVGQYSYAGCACQGIGNKTNQVMMDDSILYKGFN